MGVSSKSFKFGTLISELDNKNLLFLIVQEFCKVDLSPEAVSNAEMVRCAAEELSLV